MVLMSALEWGHTCLERCLKGHRGLFNKQHHPLCLVSAGGRMRPATHGRVFVPRAAAAGQPEVLPVLACALHAQQPPHDGAAAHGRQRGCSPDGGGDGQWDSEAARGHTCSRGGKSRAQPRAVALPGVAPASLQDADRRAGRRCNIPAGAAPKAVRRDAKAALARVRCMRRPQQGLDHCTLMLTR